MTLNEKIAESRGWTQIGVSLNAGVSGKSLWTIGSSIHGVIPEDKDKHEDEQRYIPIPNYTSDSNAAKTLIEALRGEGWTSTIDLYEDGKWDCGLINTETYKYICRHADTFELAVCRAYCAVKGITIEG